MEAGTVGMPNGIHGPQASSEAGVNGAFSRADVVMSEFPAAEGAAEAAKPTAEHSQIAGMKTACSWNEAVGETQVFVALMSVLAGICLILLILRCAEASASADVMGDQLADPSGNATQAVSEPKDPLLEALESQQEAVTADPGDFDKWVKLIGAAEKLVWSSLASLKYSFKLQTSFIRYDSPSSAF